MVSPIVYIKLHILLLVGLCNLSVLPVLFQLMYLQIIGIYEFQFLYHEKLAVCENSKTDDLTELLETIVGTTE